MKTTIKDRLIAGLAVLGYMPTTKDTMVTRYTVCVNPEVGYRYYVGKAGALRRGTTVGASVSVGDRLRQYILSAPDFGPPIAAYLDANPPAPGAEAKAVGVDIVRANLPELRTAPPFIIEAHARQWLRQNKGQPGGKR